MTEKQIQRLDGVGCDVTNCAYNGQDMMCHAEQIKVEKEKSQCGSETDTFCGTFVAK